MNNAIQARYKFTISALDELEAIANEYFRSALDVENKDAGTGFDPVTLADKAIEKLFRERILENFPDDDVIGEEYANTDRSSAFLWTIDPIDGTRAFVAGSPTFTILICLDVDGLSKIGVISQPFTGERFVSVGMNTQWHHKDKHRDISTSKTQQLEHAILASTFPEIGTTFERAAFERVEKDVKLTRYGMDGYAYGLLAAGHIDLVIEAGLKPFDYAAPRAVVQAAGGVFCGWDGKEINESGRVIAAATQELANAAIARLQEC